MDRIRQLGERKYPIQEHWLAECYRTMLVISERLGKETAESVAYQEKYERLKENINRFYWNEEKGAYIDSFSSGKNHVSRHANIFAILFDIADRGRKEQIAAKVLRNDEIPQITTSYFKFYEMDALCRMGCLDQNQRILGRYAGARSSHLLGRV